MNINYKKIKNIIISTLLVTCVVAASIPQQSVQAKTLQQLQNERSQLAKSSENAKSQLQQIKNQLATVQEEVDALDKVIQATQDEIDKAQADYDEVSARLESSKVELAQAEEEREKHFDVFKKRIKFLHENGTSGYLEIILNAENFSDALLRMQYVQDIMEYDNKLQEQLIATQETIERKTLDIAEEQAEAEAILVEHQSKLNDLDKVMAEKAATIKSYEQNEAKYEQLIASNEKASKQVETLINQASATSSYSGTVYTGGKLNWPVPAKAASTSSLSSGYGSRKRPIGSGTEFHTGYDIPAPYGSNIVAAEAGQVIYSGWMSGYGYTIMIDHGGGLVTLYAHNSSLVVSKGAKVSRGQVIAKCGSTGNSTGNHCHFEVRLNGKVTSPESYLGVKNTY